MGKAKLTRGLAALRGLWGRGGRAGRAALSAAGVAAVAVCLLWMGSSLPRLDEIGHPGAPWLAVGILAELASLAAYALIVREVLVTWHVEAPVGGLLRATVGGIAIGATLPAGQALSLTYWYRQLRGAGANPQLAAFALLAAGIAGAVSLAALLMVGVAVAGNAGPLASARLPLLVAGVVLVVLQITCRRRVNDLARRLLRHYRLAFPDDADGRKRLINIGVFACLNWLLDCASLLAALFAVGATVPLQGVLVVYALAQMVNQLPLLPGGGGSVELSLSLGFAAVGHTSGEVFAGVLLFRLISCWGLVPIGWLVVAIDNRVAAGHATC